MGDAAVAVFLEARGQFEGLAGDLAEAAPGAEQRQVVLQALQRDAIEFALPGIGPATAASIVTERERNGPFADVDDLDRVPGIGPAKLEALRDLVTT